MVSSWCGVCRGAALSLSLTWLSGLFSGIVDISENLFQQAKIRLANTFASTDTNFDVWPSEYEVKAGTRLALTAGIKNNADDGKAHAYVVNVVVGSVPAGMEAAEVRGWVTWFMNPKTIGISQSDDIKIIFTIPGNAVKGIYIFRVTACADITTDGSPAAPSAVSCGPTSPNLWGSSAKDFVLTVT